MMQACRLSDDDLALLYRLSVVTCLPGFFGFVGFAI